MNSKKILLLDDNRDLLQIVQIILKGRGYDTFLADCIDEASRKIKIHAPSLILMDVFISDEDGCAFCQQLKQAAATNKIKIILMSGADEVQRLITVAKADDFMPKPFDYDDLLNRVEKQLHFTSNAVA